MNSSRLPGKVLLPLGEKCALELIINRLKKLIDDHSIKHLVVATSNEKNDLPIVQMAKSLGAKTFCGSLNDVLDRFYQCAKQFNPAPETPIIRITADCPLADPDIIRETLELFKMSNVDFCNNNFPPTFPDGYDVGIMKFQALEEAWRKADKISDREHVTSFIINNSNFKNQEAYKAICLKSQSNLSHLRVTLDETKDLELLTIIFKKLGPNPSYIQVCNLIESDIALKRVNASIGRNEGYNKSLKKDLLD